MERVATTDAEAPLVAAAAGGSVATTDQMAAAVAAGAVTPGVAWCVDSGGSLVYQEVGNWHNVYPPSIQPYLPGPLPQVLRDRRVTAAWGVRPALPNPAEWPNPGFEAAYFGEFDATRDIYIAPWRYLNDESGETMAMWWAAADTEPIITTAPA